MKTFLLIITLLCLPGCGTFQSIGNGAVEVATSRELFVACRAADVATSWWAIAHGAYEVGSLPILPLVIINIGASILVWNLWDKTDTAGRVIANGISCIPVVNNVNVIRDLHNAPTSKTSSVLPSPQP